MLFGKHNFCQWEVEGSRGFVGQCWWGVQLPLSVPLLSVGQGCSSYLLRFGYTEKFSLMLGKTLTQLWLTSQPPGLAGVT